MNVRNYRTYKRESVYSSAIHSHDSLPHDYWIAISDIQNFY